MSLRGLGAGALALVLVVVVGWSLWLIRGDVVPFLRPEHCTATVDGRTVTLDVEQAQNAGLIAGIAVGRGLPARAVTIALATAYQESKIRNLDHGDRDSLGIFQQRPSQGWGTEAQVQDPVFATNAFYDALEQVEGYEEMEITVAAQQVQRSGFPDAYADHEDDARVLASALTGHHDAAFHCELDGEYDAAPDRLGENGLVRRAERVRADLVARFGEVSLGGFEPGGVSTGHMEGSAHYDGRAIDVFFRPVNATNRVRGWAVAHYLVSQADRLSIRTVIYDGRIWTNGERSGSGWRDYQPTATGGDPDVLAHRDHVHVDVSD